MMMCDGCIKYKAGWCQAKRSFIAKDRIHECADFDPKELEPGCKMCQSLHDDKYCNHWRDVIPDDIIRTGCSEINEYPPF